ncbi:hypothetical protein M3Y97_01119000 [Aphelenchoides bicaudatus]|nr:hypothetical protein M3Y97_01119000 [Aphelenchoides bicaudatus]
MPNYRTFLAKSMGEHYLWAGFHIDEGALIIGMICLFIDFFRLLTFIGEAILPNRLNANAIGMLYVFIQQYISIETIQIVLFIWTFLSNLSNWLMMYGNLNRMPHFYWLFVIMSAISIVTVSSLAITLLLVAFYNFKWAPVGFPVFVAVSTLAIMDINCFLFFQTVNRSRLSLEEQLRNMPKNKVD